MYKEEQPIYLEKPEKTRRSQGLWRELAIRFPVITVLLVAACAENGSSIKIEDTNGDKIIDVLDVRAREGTDWLPGLDFNGDSVIDEKDVGLVKIRVGTKPDVPLYDVDGSGEITCEDAAIVENHVGETVQEDDDSKKARDTAYLANQTVIYFKGDEPQDKINELLTKRQYTKLSQQPLYRISRIQVIAEIPDAVLEKNNLDTEIKEVSEEESVISANRVYITHQDDIIGQAKPCLETPSQA